MALQDAKHIFKGSICVQDVPLLLRIVLRVSQVMGAAPMRLRRARTGWLLGVSRGLVVFQRVVLVMTGACVLTALIYDILEENEDKRVFMGDTEVVSFLGGSELVFLFLVHLFGVLSATDTIKSMMAILQQTKKMNCNNYLFKDVKYQRIRLSMLIFFIIWKIASHLAITQHIVEKCNQNKIINGLYAPCIYQHLVTDMFQLLFSSTVAAINFVLTKINDQLERLLTKPAIIHYSVKTKVYPNKFKNETKIFDDFPLPESTTSIVWELNWSSLLLSNMMAIVEPCHWLQDQMKRTRSLLSQIATRCGHSNEDVSRELDLFILQVQTNNATFAPLGIFVVARPLVASIIGSVFTYLVIVIQMMNAPKPL